MSDLRFAAAATLGILALSGCSILDPFPTLPVPLSAGQTPATPSEKPRCVPSGPVRILKSVIQLAALTGSVPAKATTSVLSPSATNPSVPP